MVDGRRQRGTEKGRGRACPRTTVRSRRSWTRREARSARGRGGGARSAKSWRRGGARASGGTCGLGALGGGVDVVGGRLDLDGGPGQGGSDLRRRRPLGRADGRAGLEEPSVREPCLVDWRLDGADDPWVERFPSRVGKCPQSGTAACREHAEHAGLAQGHEGVSDGLHETAPRRGWEEPRNGAGVSVSACWPRVGGPMIWLMGWVSVLGARARDGARGG
jgi:hypothetical protein